MSAGSDNLLSHTGESLELVNLRFSNGSLCPVPRPIEQKVLQQEYSHVFWHPMAECYICVCRDNGKVHFYNSSWNRLTIESGEPLLFDELSGVKGIELIGYLVVFNTLLGLRYAIFNSGTYKWLGNLPQIPSLDISVSSKLHELTSTASFTSDTLASNLESSWRFNEKGYIDEAISYLNKKGYYIDRALFCFALRLFDGSYIYCSHVVYVSDENVVDYVARDSSNLVSECVGNAAEAAPYRVKVLGFRPDFSFSNLKLENWESIVVGIDLFSTVSIMGKKPDAITVNLHGGDNNTRINAMVETYVDKELNELWNDISSASSYYKIAEFDIYGNCLSRTEDVSPVNLVLQPSLANSEVPYTLNSQVAGCTYTLNNRLHIGDVKELFFKGYDPSFLKPLQGEYRQVAGITVQTKIRTRNSTIAVTKDYGSVELGYKNNLFELPPLLSYPDSRAYEITVLANIGDCRIMKAFPLKAHEVNNSAHYLHKWYSGHIVAVESHFKNGGSAEYVDPDTVLEIFSSVVGVHEVVYSSTIGSWTYNDRKFPPEKYSSLRVFAVPRNVADGDKIVFTIEYGVSDTSFKDINNIPLDSTWEEVEDGFTLAEECDSEYRPDIVKVSLVDNPFLFSPKSTLSPSQGRVLAMISNTVALSQGQFGEHPLYLFCENGIWAMAVDPTGTVAYSASYPVSREVCTNPSALCGIDSGVVFLGSKGVMLLSGSRLKHISSVIDNDNAVNIVASNPSLSNMAAIIFPGGGVVADVSFMEYMQGATTLYLPHTGEILFFNGKKKFSYVYSIVNNAWSKVSGTISGAINSYPNPQCFVSTGAATRILAFSEAMSGDNNVLLFTRPMLWGTKLPKRIMQLMLHAYVSAVSSGNHPFLGCYLLCSNDGVNFKLVSGCEKLKECNDVVFPYFPTQSYKYFVLALLGSIGADSCITGVELELSLAWNNRLR